MVRPRTTPGMKYAALEQHSFVLVACLDCMKELGVNAIGEIPPDGWHWLEAVEFDHDPALGFDRKFHKVKYLAPKCDGHHLVKTKRDIGDIARMKRRREAFAEHLRTLRAKAPGQRRELKNTIASPGFDTRFKRRLNGRTESRI